MFSCRKSYQDIPFAHRQNKHDGDCAFVHGHNWTFTFEFSSERLDDVGFVIDFGKLGFIRNEINRRFDHAFVFNRGDQASEALIAAHPNLFKGLEVECCSCEGLAQYLFELFDPQVRQATGQRTWISAVEVQEDRKNSAAYRPPHAR